MMIYIFIPLTVLPAAMILFTRNVLYCAYLLGASLLSLAALFVMGGNSFLAVSQIMVIVGGVVVLIVFGVMLTNRLAGKVLTSGNRNLYGGVLLGLAVLFLLVAVATGMKVPGDINGSDKQIPAIGSALMTEYLLAFEAIAILLLVAIIGAAVTSGVKPSENE